MNITFVINSLTSGGAERALSSLANHWAQAGHKITILTFDSGAEPPFFELDPSIVHRPLGIGMRGLPLLHKFLNLPRACSMLRKGISASRPGVVIAFMDQANMLALRCTPKAIPVLVCEQVEPGHSSIFAEHLPAWLRGYLKRTRDRLYTKAASIVVLSKRSVDYFPKRLEPKIRVIPNPIIVPPQQTADQTLPQNTILAMGRLTKQKNFALLIRAFADLISETDSAASNSNLTIAGEGELRRELEELIEQLGIEDRVKLVGRTRTPYALMRQAKLFVLSSDYEGFPLVLGEAMACGLPVVASDCPTGPSEMIENGKNGLLFSVGDGSALRDCLKRMMTDTELRSRLARAAPTILERFHVSKVASAWEGLFLQREQPLRD